MGKGIVLQVFGQNKMALNEKSGDHQSYYSSSNSHLDVLHKTTNVNRMVALEGKSGDISSGSHESIQKLLIYFSLDQTDGPTLPSLCC